MAPIHQPLPFIPHSPPGTAPKAAIRTCLWLTLILISLLSTAPSPLWAQFTEDYSDGEIHQNPTWWGDTALFRVDVAGRLQQQAPAASGSTHLYTHSRAIYQTDWSWWMRLGFNPSGSNYADVYLLSQSPRLDSALSGYFVRVGSTADDVSLFRQTGNTRTCIINGRDGTLNRDDNPLRIRVTRDTAGVWTIYTDTTGSGIHWQSEGTTYDATHNYGSYAGHRQVYSSTRSSLYWYDDWVVNGQPYPDTLPPRLLMARVARQGVVKLQFNKGMPPGILMQPQQYALSGFGFPFEVELPQPNAVELRWNMPLPDEGPYRLCIMLTDSGGVPLDTCGEWEHYAARQGDLIFNEIMAVPPLQGPLPPLEFVELRNRSSHTLNVGDWTLSDRSTTVLLPAYSLEAGGHLVICEAGQGMAWPPGTPVVEVTPWPQLNNEEDELRLGHPDGWRADTLAYSEAWHTSPIKKLGGWSLERRIGRLPCMESWNWGSSEDASGGTPGRVNSLDIFDSLQASWLAAHQPPAARLLHAALTADRSVHLQFSRPVRPGQASLGGHPIPISPPYEPGFRWTLPGWLAPPAVGTEWLTLEGWADCRDSPVVATQWPLAVGTNAPASSLFFHEIYFRPADGGVPYYELIHLGEAAIDLSRVFLAEADESGQYSTAIALSEEPSAIIPGQRVVFCRDTAALRVDFGEIDTENRRQVPSLPLPKAGGGHAILLDHAGRVLDRLSYHDSLHHPVVAEPKGLALEKPDGQVFAPWSTADTRIRGTPGRPNSRSPTQLVSSGTLSVAPLVVYPRRMERMRIALDCEGEGVVRIDILDADGRLLAPLLPPTLCRGTAEVYWDGRDASGRWVREGSYLVRADFLEHSRQPPVFRRVAVSWMNP